jgi:AcrR family transcriptional regulator
LNAAETLLLEHGAEGVSIRRVSKLCGFSAPTIYHHFGDKRGLIDAVVDGRLREVIERMREVPRGDAASYLREMARVFVRFALANPSHYWLLHAPPGPNGDMLPSAAAVRALVREGLSELADAGKLATEDSEAAFQVTWAVMHGLISLQLTRPDFEFDEKLLELALDVIEHGMLRGRET